MLKPFNFLWLTIFFCVKSFSQEFNDPSRTEYKDDAGLQGSKSGFFQTGNPVNYPAGASNWWHLLDVRHTNTANNYAMQFAGSFFDGNLYFRKTNNNPSQMWSRVLLETNGYVGIGTTNPVSNLTVAQTSTSKNGLWITGAEYTDPLAGADKNNGISITLGYNGPGNRQVWIGSSEVIGSSSAGLIRFLTGPTIPSIDAVTGNGASRLHLNLATATTNVIVGNNETSLIPSNKLTVYGNSSIGTGYYNVAAPTNGLLVQGNVGIGTSAPGNFKLAVNGDAIFKRVQVKTSTPWPDYVFHPGYQLPSLSSLEVYINQNKHLPDLPSAEEVDKDGHDLGATQAVLLKKIEELTLYVIRLNKKIEELQAKKW